MARGDFCPESGPLSPKSHLRSVVHCPKPAGIGDFQWSMVWWRETEGLGGGGGSQARTRLRTNSLIAWSLQGKTSKLQGFDPGSSAIHPYFQPVTGIFPKVDNRELNRPIRELSGKSGKSANRATAPEAKQHRQEAQANLLWQCHSGASPPSIGVGSDQCGWVSDRCRTGPRCRSGPCAGFDSMRSASSSASDRSMSGSTNSVMPWR